MKSLNLFTFVLCGGMAVVLAACGTPQSAVDSPRLSQENASAGAGAHGGCPLQHCIIVADAQAARGLDGAIFFSRETQTATCAPVEKIEGSHTGLRYTSGVAMDGGGNVYAANLTAKSITVYAAGARGNVAPIRAIAGSRTELQEPAGIAIDIQ